MTSFSCVAGLSIGLLALIGAVRRYGDDVNRAVVAQAPVAATAASSIQQAKERRVIQEVSRVYRSCVTLLSLMSESPQPDPKFPILTADQLQRLHSHGRVRRAPAGETIIAIGQPSPPFYALKSGTLEVVQPARTGDVVIVTHQPGEFTGEVSLLSGRPSLVDVRTASDTELIEVQRADLLAVVQSDSELSEILMRAFLLRRAVLLARRAGDVLLIGSDHSARTLEVKEFLTRNGHPYTHMDLDRDHEVQALLDQFQVTEADMPVVIGPGDAVMRNPSNREIAARLQISIHTVNAQLVTGLMRCREYLKARGVLRGGKP